MDQEFETKVVDINPSQIIAKLRSLGALEIPEVLTRRWVFDDIKGDGRWIRLRDTDGKFSLTLKQRGSGAIGETTEVEIEVSDFDKTYTILSSLKFADVYYQESKRHLFVLDGIEFSLDSWPLISTFLEIESSSKEKVAAGLEVLGLTGKDVGDKDVLIIYQEHSIDMHSFKELKFS